MFAHSLTLGDMVFAIQVAYPSCVTNVWPTYNKC